MSIKKCFSLEHVARPLLLGASLPPQPEAPKSVPKVSTLIELGPRPSKIRRREANAECAVAIYPYTKDAATIWEACTEQGATLWQVQLEHNARDSITVGFYESFTKFLQQEESAPDSINGLAEAGIKLLLTDTSDPDQVGFIRWRAAFYVYVARWSLESLIGESKTRIESATWGGATSVELRSGGPGLGTVRSTVGGAALEEAPFWQSWLGCLELERRNSCCIAESPTKCFSMRKPCNCFEAKCYYQNGYYSHVLNHVWSRGTRY